jgi:hypothetical protein
MEALMPNLTKEQRALKRVTELEAELAAQQAATTESPAKTEVQTALDSGANARFNINIAGHDFVIHKGHLMFRKDPEGLALLEGLEAALYAGTLEPEAVIDSTTTLVVGKEKDVDKTVTVNGVEIQLGGNKPRANNAGGFTRSTVQMQS